MAEGLAEYDGALLKTTYEIRHREEWTSAMELQAQTVELLSILTTKKFATKKPREVRRPGWVKDGGAPQAEQASGGNPFARAIDRVLGTGAPRPGAARDGEYVGTPPAHLRESM